MGASLVAEVLARWTHVSDRAFRVLVRMALTALDNPKPGQPAGIYRGGRDLLAMSLRSEKGTAETRYRAVKRALSELSEAGAIQHVQSGWAGRNAVYRLTLGASRSIDEHDSNEPGMGGQISPPEGGPTSPPSGGSIRAERGVPETPRRNQEEPVLQELREEEGVEVDLTSHRSRANGPPESGSVIHLFPKPPNRPPLRRGSGRAAEALEAAAARRRAAEAEHRARLAAGDAP